MRDERPSIVHWNTRELVLIGTFAALIKLITLTVSLMGGGMNPVTLLLKNIVATALLVVLFHKVPRVGVLTLYVLQQAIIMMMLMGSGLIILPGYLVAALLVEGGAHLLGGYRNTWAILLSIGLYDLFSRAISLGLSWLFMRENSALFLAAFTIIAVGYLGCLIGLRTGVRFVREFRHAGFIRE